MCSLWSYRPLISGFTFSLGAKRSISHYFKDPEFKFYISTLLGITLIALIVLIVTNTYEPAESLRKATFMVVSIATTSGFATADFAHWPAMLPFLLFVATFAGGCAGSTGGGDESYTCATDFETGLP